MSLTFRSVRRATASAIAIGLTAAGLLTTACSPPPAYKYISGTIKGVDGKIVDVMVGFDILDAFGRKIDLGYIKAGYSSIQRLNHCVPTNGATSSQKCPGTGQVTGYNWSLRVPANATTAYIEVYPKRPTPNNWVTFRGYTGPMPGTTDTSTYAMCYRRAIPLPGSVGNVSIVLPKVWGVPGGSTGSLVGHISNWPGGVTGSINAWSRAANQPTMGFAMGSVNGAGNYRIDGLQSHQSYTLVASGGGYNRTINDPAYDMATLVPAPGYQKYFNF
jgi:hypothetical protein